MQAGSKKVIREGDFISYKDSFGSQLCKYLESCNIVKHLQLELRETRKAIKSGVLKSSKEIYKSFCFKTHLYQFSELSSLMKNNLPVEDFVKSLVNKEYLTFDISIVGENLLVADYVVERLTNTVSVRDLVKFMLNIMQACYDNMLATDKGRYVSPKQLGGIFKDLSLLLKKLWPLLKEFYQVLNLKKLINYGSSRKVCSLILPSCGGNKYKTFLSRCGTNNFKSNTNNVIICWDIISKVNKRNVCNEALGKILNLVETKLSGTARRSIMRYKKPKQIFLEEVEHLLINVIKPEIDYTKFNRLQPRVNNLLPFYHPTYQKFLFKRDTIRRRGLKSILFLINHFKGLLSKEVLFSYNLKSTAVLLNRHTTRIQKAVDNIPNVWLKFNE